MSIVIPTRINQTSAQWAVDGTLYTANKILVTTDEFYTSSTVPKFKFADGSNTWDNLDYFTDVQLQLNTHTSNTSNPHNVTKAQVGLALANNTADANKPLSSELSGTLSTAVVLNSAVLAKLLTGLNITGSSIAATDNLLVAFGKLQSQLNGVLGGAIYQGVWNATTNSPALADGTGVKGHYYVVSVAGTQNLGSGNIEFAVGDWVIHNGTIYQKVDNTDAVSSVNGFTGAVSLTTADISEVTNLYYTNARVNTQLNTYTGNVTFLNGVSTIGALQVTNSMIANTTIDLTAKVTGVLPVANGGTNLSTIASGSVVVANALNVYSAVTSVAGNKGLINDAGVVSWSTVTGTGAPVRATSPTFITQIETPIVLGGTGIASRLDLVGSNNVAVTAAAIGVELWYGNSGVLSGARLYQDGQFIFGVPSATTIRNTTAFGFVRIGQGDTVMDFGQLAAGEVGIWANNGGSSNSATNAVIRTNGTTSTRLNSPSAAGSVFISFGATARYTFTTSTIALTPLATTSGNAIGFTYTAPASTGQAAATEVASVNWNMSATLQHLSNTTISTQRDFLIQPRTHSFQTAGGIITEAGTLVVGGGVIAGTNAGIGASSAILVQSTAVGAGVTNSYGLTVNAQTGATDNWAAQFVGGAILMKGASANSRLRSARLLYRDTTDATVTEVTTDGAAGSGSANRIAVPTNCGMSVVLNICVKQSGSSNTKQFLRQFVITNNAGTTGIEGTVTVLGTDVGSAALALTAVTITANNTDDCVKVEVTGLAATNLRWTAYIVSTEVIY